MIFVKLLGAVFALAGSVFLLLASIGIYRMPDAYNRIQAGTKATTLGSMLFLLGVGLNVPEWLGQIILVILFIALTNPVSSHVLARAAHYAKIKLTEKTVRDELAQDEENMQERGEK